LIRLSLNINNEITRFLIVGILNTAISYLVFILVIQVLNQTIYKATIAQAISYGCGLFWSYIWNRRWTFKSTIDIRKEYLSFAKVQIYLLVISTLLAYIFIDYIGLHTEITWVAITGMITAMNFIALRALVFLK
jgi:putative flippase GtrA